ncbi:glycoside hydrolase family 18 protein [Sphingobacterium sp. MYb382]|uniref:glycoside hydrolase family 18 protein n=1 Tax=Sphingobacterium sp. MYb382 TaxID=2745278 RepID=UPI003099F053
MKKIVAIIAVALILFQLGCSNDKEYTFDSDFYPRIFDNGNTFTSPNRIVEEGASVNFNRLSFSPSPSKGMEISWKVNGQHVSSDTAFVFTPPNGGGEFEVTLEASFKGNVSTRKSKVLVSPSTYAPKPFDQIALSYLTENGNASFIDWKQVTHVAFNGARVLPEGGIDFSKGDLNQVTDELVARAHLNGIPFLLSVSGRLSGVDGWALYNNSDFGDVISNPTLMAQLVTTLVDYVERKKIDGIDVLMTDLSNDDAAIAGRNAAAVGPFINALKAALQPGKLVTATVTTNYLHWNYTDLSQADWIHVRAYDDGAHVSPGAPLGQSSTLDYMISSAAVWTNKGFAKNKLVLGMPAYGIRYDELDSDGNNLSWGSYTNVSYTSILQASSDADAYKKDYLPNIGKGVYYNGVVLIKEKADYVKEQGFKGAYLWAGDYDVKDNRSLMATIKANIK